jgi:hypothetical protein
MSTQNRRQPLLAITSLNQLELLRDEFGEVQIHFTAEDWHASLPRTGLRSRSAADLGDAIQDLYIAAGEPGSDD